MSSFKGFVIIGIFFGLSVWLINIFLGIDDLASCQTSPGEEANCKKTDAIVAVSGGDTLARTEEAVRLYKAGWSDTLVFSGAALDKSGPSNAETMRRHAIEIGVPAEAIHIEETSETTKENAAKTVDLFEQQHITHIIVVTSPYHERRAVLEFQRRSSALTVQAHPTLTDKYWPIWWWVTPYGWYLAISELIKTIFVYVGGAVAL